MGEKIKVPGNDSQFSTNERSRKKKRMAVLVQNNVTTIIALQPLPSTKQVATDEGRFLEHFTKNNSSVGCKLKKITNKYDNVNI